MHHYSAGKACFADIDEKTYNISPADILERITPRTKAIIPVHYGGQPCDMKEVSEIASDHKLLIVEDCAHSLGAEYCGVQTGNLGTTGCFSFYPTKIITTFEGGMITTNDETIDKRLRLLREHGMNRTAIDRESNNTWYYDVTDIGYNYRLSEPQAALGTSQLGRISEGIKLRVRVANYYTERLSSLANKGVVTPTTSVNRSHVFHLYTIRIKNRGAGITRDFVFKRLLDDGIQSSVLYTPLHKMSFYKQFLNKRKCAFPIAEKLSGEIVSLPIYPLCLGKKWI